MYLFDIKPKIYDSIRHDILRHPKDLDNQVTIEINDLQANNGCGIFSTTIDIEPCGAGFSGSHLAEHLMKQGEEVVILDDLSTGRFDNIRHLVEKKGFKYYIGKVEDRRLLERILTAGCFRGCPSARFSEKPLCLHGLSGCICPVFGLGGALKRPHRGAGLWLPGG